VEIKNLFRKFTPALLFSFLVICMLVLNTFFPDAVNVDKYTAWFLALLFIMVILPSLKKASIAYFFSFERDLKRARNSVEKLQKVDGTTNGEVKKKVKKKMSNATDVSNAYLTTGKIKDQIKKRLFEIQRRWVDKDKRVKGVESGVLAKHLHEQGIISGELYEAITEILSLSTPEDYITELTPEDVGQILEASLPVLERLHELAKFYG